MFDDASQARLVRQSGNGRVTIPVTVTLSSDQVDVLEALAQTRQCSLSVLVRHVIAHGLAVDPQRGAARYIEVDGVLVPPWMVVRAP